MKTNYFTPIKFNNNCLELLDQRKLPHEEIVIYNKTLQDCYDSIKEMVVRGAPCIGFTAIFAMALWVKNNDEFTLSEFKQAADYLKTSRPTAVNLAFEIDRAFFKVKDNFDKNINLYELLVSFGNEQLQLSEKYNMEMAKAAFLELENLYGDKKLKLLTHCNTGHLACGSMGTALGVIQYAAQNNRIDKVWVDETRPYLQGSRLTSYELTKLNIHHDIVVEGAASHLMKNGLVDAIFVGADRIAANGDTANKIGTSNLAIIAKHYKIPFYVVAPKSSFDISIQSGEKIEIELRPQEEITYFKGEAISPISASSYNPSFDVTDGTLISAIFCEDGRIVNPYQDNILKVLNG